MSPKVSRSKRGELPKPVIRSGSLGFFPLNSFSASCLYQGHGDLVIGFRDRPETVALKTSPKVRLVVGDKKRELSLDGRYFNGYTDALYRGKLPEVMWATPTVEELPDFLEDFVEYVEQLLSLGFFLPRKEIVKRNPVADLVPCTIVSGPGILFSRFITGLMHYLRLYENQRPEMNENMRTQLVGRFVRGVFTGDNGLQHMDACLSPGEAAPLRTVSSCIRLAGGSRHTQETIQSVLSQHGLVASIENRAKNPVERLELENALWRLSTVTLPTLVAHKVISVKDGHKLSSCVEQGVLTIGRCRNAFDETDSAETLTVIRGAAGKSLEQITLGPEDLAILQGLHGYADALGLQAEIDLFASLADQVLSVAGKHD